MYGRGRPKNVNDSAVFRISKARGALRKLDQTLKQDASCSVMSHGSDRAIREPLAGLLKNMLRLSASSSSLPD